MKREPLRAYSLDSTYAVYKVDRSDTPAITVTPPCIVSIGTLDARGGRLKQPEDVFTTAPDFSERFPRGNPATGPIGIEGAVPGDTLLIKVLDIGFDPVGFVLVKPDFGVLPTLVSEPVARMIPVTSTHVFLGEFAVPIRPMIGVLATAPAGEPVGTAFVGPHGGNMDNPMLTVGTTAFMPVTVPGALLYLGDLHAAMGDGEASGTGVEIGGHATVLIEVLKGVARSWPWMETNDLLISCASAETFDAAAEIAVSEMVSYLSLRHGMSAVDAFMFVSIAGNLRVNQACRSAIDVSVRVEVPQLGELRRQPLSEVV